MPVGKPIQLLIFAHALEGRGTEKSIVRLLRAFDRSVLTPRLVLASARGQFLKDVPSDVPVYDLGVRSGRTSSAAIRLSRLLRKMSPDCAMGIHISAGRLLAALRLVHPKLPVICVEADPFTRIERSKGRLALRLVVSRLTYRLASGIIAASDVVADELVAHLHVPSEKISLIPLASVDDDIPRLAQESLREAPFVDGAREPIIITVGNMFDHKDQATLLHAFALVQRSTPSHLVLIGEGPMRAQLEQLALELGLQERVWFKGFQQNPYKYIARSQVFASSSIAEGFDISQIEAMACGVPAVVTDAPRFQAVTHRATGLTVPPKDPLALAEAVIELLSSPDLSASLARNALGTVEEFSARKIARRYEALIADLAERR